MEIRVERRGITPQKVEDIGLGQWHLRWNIAEKINPEDDSHYFEYNEVTLDHKPTTTEIKNITA